MSVGYYQFDNRYGLLDFIRAVYAYDPSKYSMFEQFNYIADSTFKADNAMRQNGQFTALGVALNSSWKAAYAADAEEISRLQVMAGNISSTSNQRLTISILVESTFIAVPMPFRAFARACATFLALLDWA